MKGKRGLSGVVTAVLLILLAIALVAIVWGVVQNLVETKVEESSCLDAVGKVGFNHQYVCYNSSVNSTEFMFSVSIGDIEIEEVVIAISSGGTKKSFNLRSEISGIDYLRPSNGTYFDGVVLPGKNAGLTYFYNMSAAGFSEWPDSIEISPEINDNMCQVTDSSTDIPPCYALG